MDTTNACLKAIDKSNVYLHIYDADKADGKMKKITNRMFVRRKKAKVNLLFLNLTRVIVSRNSETV